MIILRNAEDFDVMPRFMASSLFKDNDRTLLQFIYQRLLLAFVVSTVCLHKVKRHKKASSQNHVLEEIRSNYLLKPLFPKTWKEFLVNFYILYKLMWITSYLLLYRIYGENLR